MCGIVGIVRRAGEAPVSGVTLNALCDTIRHRGPDDTGTYVDGGVGLGMRRLSIIDLEGGHQPISNEDGSKVIVFNGEIYNYAELRRDLIQRGHKLRTSSDTETIVHLYEDHGADCVKRLRGMFAFAIWDASRQQLVLARDRFGIKPLYVAMNGRQITFGSELKALVRAGVTTDGLDWPALESFFTLGYIPAPFAPFRGVRKLEPGHVLLWRPDGSWSSRAYWDVPTGDVESHEDVEARVLEWLDESVRAHLVSDVPLAMLLSGGIDSSAVFSSMALAGAAPHAYTARYHGSGADRADETGLARQLANRYGAKLTVVDIEPRLTDLLEPIARALDEPHADESAVPNWIISEHVARDYKVVLSGTGGDELFAGYRRYAALRLSDRYTRLPAAARAALTAVANLLPEPRGGHLAVHRLKRFLRTSPGSVPSRYVDLLNKLPSKLEGSVFSAATAHAMGSGRTRQRFDELHDGASGLTGLQAPLYLDYKTYLPDDILHVSDRLSMAHSLEVRVPFVDHVLVENAFRLPDRHKVRGREMKHVLRKALRGRLPDAHFDAPKRGFVGPTALWLRHELRDMITDELSATRIDRLGFFDSRTIGRLLADHLNGRHNHESVLWALLSFSLWYRVYCEDRETMPGDAQQSPIAVAL